MKRTRDTTALVKDLEKQVDFLVGYRPTGAHWKQEYHVRKAIIDEAIASDTTPDEVRDKINRILESLYELREGKEHDQSYLAYQEHHTVIEKEGGIIIGSFDLEGPPLKGKTTV